MSKTETPPCTCGHPWTAHVHDGTYISPTTHGPTASNGNAPTGAEAK